MEKKSYRKIGPREGVWEKGEGGVREGGGGEGVVGGNVGEEEAAL